MHVADSFHTWCPDRLHRHTFGRRVVFLISIHLSPLWMLVFLREECFCLFFLVNPHFLLLFRGRVVVLWQRTDSVTVGYDTSVEMIFVSGHLIGKVYGVFLVLLLTHPTPQCINPPLSTAQPAVRDSQPPKKWLFLTEEINLFVIPIFNLFCNKII